MSNKTLFAVSVCIAAFPMFASALTLQDLELQLRFVSTQLKTLYSQSGAVAVAAAGSLNSSPECPILTRELKQGDSDATTGGEVSLLQGFLVRKGEISQKAFSEMPKGYFGHLTQVALESWQTRHNLLATGKTDAVTRTSIVECRDIALPAPEISIGADKEYAFRGESVTISWETQDATQCTLTTKSDGGLSSEKTVGLNGSITIEPTVSATVNLTCINNVGLETKGPETSQSIRVLVDQPLSSEDISSMSQVSAALAALESMLLQILAR